MGASITTFTYDRNGNMKTRVSGSSTTTYTYDAENRLTSVATSSSTTTYAYTADGRRLKRVSGGTTTYFGNDPLSPGGYDDTIEEYTSTGAKTATYVHGTGGDELLGYKTTSWSSYHTDALGSVTRLTDAAGGTTSTYRYDAFGGIRAQSGSGNTYGYTSREGEPGLGLYYNRARYYEPSSGRFLSADPAGGGYAYVGGNPVNRIDPSGMRVEESGGWIGGEGAAAWISRMGSGAGFAVGALGGNGPTCPPGNNGRGNAYGHCGGGVGEASPEPMSPFGNMRCALAWTFYFIGIGFAALGIWNVVLGAKAMDQLAYYMVTGFAYDTGYAAASGDVGAIINIVLSLAWWAISNFIIPVMDWLARIVFGAQIVAKYSNAVGLALSIAGLVITALVGLHNIRSAGC